MLRVKNPTEREVRLQLFGLGELHIPPLGITEISVAMWGAIQNPALWGDSPCPLVIYTEQPKAIGAEEEPGERRKPGRYRVKEE